MYYYRQKLSRHSQGIVLFVEKPEQGIWHHGMLGVFYFSLTMVQRWQVCLILIM